MRSAMWVGGGITGLGEIPILGVREKGIAKVIRDIFRGGEQGFFYDPFDLKTQYQDAAGTTAVNATGQPLGLVLDKSKGLALGPELVDLSMWVARDNTKVTAIGNKVRISAIANGAWGADLTFMSPPISGRRYQILFNLVKSNLSTSIYARFTVGGATVYGAGTHALVELSTGSTAAAIASTTGTADEYVEVELSVVEVPGNHAYQPTSAARPIFRQKPILGSDAVPKPLNLNSSEWTLLGTGTTANGASFTVTGSVGAGPVFNKLEVGKEYLIDAAWSVNSNVPIEFRADGSSAAPVLYTSSARKASFTFKAVTKNLYLRVPNFAGPDTFTFTKLSITEVKGYRTDQNYIEYDGVDDKLITNLPSQLNNCTVLRAIPDVGTQVKYNQTLPMLYEDSTNHAGLLAINRALTRKEQLRLMQELDKRAGATSLEILTLKAFDNNQEGFVFDPNDLSTMFQDAAGTVPVTAAGQPVGLILDKSKGLKLGEELWKNTAPTIVDSGESAGSYDPVSKTLSNAIPSGVNARPIFRFPFDWQAGKRYLFKGKFKSGYEKLFASGIRFGAAVGYAQVPVNQITGEFSAITTSPDAAVSIIFAIGQVGDIVIDYISIKEVLGNHAYQDTSASRPILRQNTTTGAYFLAFDGVDDFMVTAPLKLAEKKELTIHVGILALPTARSYEYLLANGNNTTDNGLIRLRIADPNSQKFEVNSGTYVVVDGPSAATRPEKRVIGAKFSSIEPYHSFTVNGVTSEKVIQATKDTTLTTLPMYIGRQVSGSWQATMELYGLTLVSAITSVDFDRRVKLDYENKMGI